MRRWSRIREKFNAAVLPFKKESQKLLSYASADNSETAPSAGPRPAPREEVKGSEKPAEADEQPVKSSDTVRPNRWHGLPLYQRILGIIGFVLGVVGIFIFSGISRDAASAVLVVGLLFAITPLPWERNRRDIISLVLAVIGIVLLPAGVINFSPAAPAVSCAGQPEEPPQSVYLQPYASHGNPSFSSTVSQSVFLYKLTFPYYEWAGYYAAIPNYCKYQIDFDAREIARDDSQGASGWGYGVGLCSQLNYQVPAGLSLQDNFQVGLNGISTFGQVLLPSPDAAYGEPLNEGAYINTKWHHWTLSFSRNYWTVAYDGHTLIKNELLSGAPPLPNSCINSDLLFRIWGGTAEFENIRIS